MKLKLLCFGICRDIIGATISEIEVAKGISANELKEQLKVNYPALTKLNHLHVAINEEYADNNLIIKEGDEIALVPPVSGG